MIKEEDRGFQRYHSYCPNDNCTNQNIDFVVKTDKEIII